MAIDLAATYYTAYQQKRQVHRFTKRKHMGNPLRRAIYKAMRLAKEKGLVIRDMLAYRQERAAYIRALTQLNMIAVYSRYRDCDHVWGDSWQLMRPIPRAVERYMDEARQNAEGPGVSYVLTPRDLVTKLKAEGNW